MFYIALDLEKYYDYMQIVEIKKASWRTLFDEIDVVRKLALPNEPDTDTRT